MIKKLVLGLSVVTFLAVPLEAFASSKNAVEPKGAERTRQYFLIVKLCQKKFGPDATAEWGSHYSETHWWCRNHV